MTPVDRSWDVRAVILKRDAVRRTEFLCAEEESVSRFVRFEWQIGSILNLAARKSVRVARYVRED